MALRQIRVYGDDILTKKCREVKEMTPRLQELIDDMLETMYDADGVGLAAPQVGVLRRIVVIDVGEGPIVLVNPRITLQEGEQEGIHHNGSRTQSSGAAQDQAAGRAVRQNRRLLLCAGQEIPGHPPRSCDR